MRATVYSETPPKQHEQATNSPDSAVILWYNSSTRGEENSSCALEEKHCSDSIRKDGILLYAKERVAKRVAAAAIMVPTRKKCRDVAGAGCCGRRRS